MKPTDILRNEHRTIEQVLTCLERMAEEAEVTRRLPVDRVLQACDFFRSFADRCHHGKEEAQLFPQLEAAGFSPENGPTAVMRVEHEQGRQHVRQLREAAERAAREPQQALSQFLSHARSYVSLLREHIQKEDHCLFPMAEEALSEAATRDLLERFHAVEAEEIGRGTHEKYEALAAELCRAYDVSPQGRSTSP